MYLSTQRPYEMHQSPLMSKAWRAYQKIGAQLRELEDRIFDFSRSKITDANDEEIAEIRRELIAAQVILTDQFIREETAALSRLLVEITDGPVTDLCEDRRDQEEVES